MQFVTVTIAGSAPRGYLGITAPPGPDAIQSAIAGVFASDGFVAQSLVVQAPQTGLIDWASSGGNPYTATVTMAWPDDNADPNVVAQTIAQEIGKALGQPPDTIGPATSSNVPTAPAAPPSNNPAMSIETILITLVVLGIVAVVLIGRVETA